MTPMLPRKKKPNLLRSLQISEISLVDTPANSSIDPVTGRRTEHARVALYKRDDSSNSSSGVQKQFGSINSRKEQPTMSKVSKKFSAVVKSATTQAEITEAVIQKAGKIARKEGISHELAEAKAWARPGVLEAYEGARPGAVKSPRRMAKVTAAEAELDLRARKKMRKTGCTYSKAIADSLEEDPSLYQRYEKEVAAGATYDVPENEYTGTGTNSGPQLGQKATPPPTNSRVGKGATCGQCGSAIERDDKYCANCGSSLASWKR